LLPASLFRKTRQRNRKRKVRAPEGSALCNTEHLIAQVVKLARRGRESATENRLPHFYKENGARVKRQCKRLPQALAIGPGSENPAWSKANFNHPGCLWQRKNGPFEVFKKACLFKEGGEGKLLELRQQCFSPEK